MASGKLEMIQPLPAEQQKADTEKMKNPAAADEDLKKQGPVSGSTRIVPPARAAAVISSSSSSTAPAASTSTPPSDKDMASSTLVQNGEIEKIDLEHILGRLKLLESHLGPSVLVRSSTTGTSSIVTSQSTVAAARAMQNAEREANFLVNLEYDEAGESPEETRKKRVAREALKMWKETVQALEGKVERRSKEIDGLNFEIYQLLGLFCVFAGVVFTAVTQPNTLELQHIWIPVVLCIFAYFVTVRISVSKFRSIEILQGTNHRDDLSRTTARIQIRKLKSFGHVEFDFTRDIPEVAPKEYKHHPTAERVTLIGLTVFSLLLSASFLHILLTNKHSNCSDCMKSCI